MKTKLELVSGDCVRLIKVTNVQWDQQRHKTEQMAIEILLDTSSIKFFSFMFHFFYKQIFTMNVLGSQ